MHSDRNKKPSRNDYYKAQSAKFAKAIEAGKDTRRNALKEGRKLRKDNMLMAARKLQPQCPQSPITPEAKVQKVDMAIKSVAYMERFQKWKDQKEKNQGKKDKKFIVSTSSKIPDVYHMPKFQKTAVRPTTSTVCVAGPSGSSTRKKTPAKRDKNNEQKQVCKAPTVASAKFEIKAESSTTTPYVTISRGKQNTIREYKQIVLQTEVQKTPDPAVVRFRRLLQNEIDALQQKCQTWSTYKEANSLSDSAEALIDRDVGQTQLLINKKFKQFESLINDCEANTKKEFKVIPTDLEGFWDMLYIQIRNVHDRFDNLRKLRENGWRETSPASKAPKIKNKASDKKKVAKPSSNSNLRNAIRAARLKNKEKNKENAECVEISTPSGKFSVSVQSSANVKDADGAKKLFKNLASRRYSSPGLVMMKVTSSAKKLAETTTPCGILKRAAFTSAKKKSVVFKNEREDLLKATRLQF